jgi:hypothetical protein
VPDPKAEYTRRLAARVKIVAEKERRHIAFGNAKVGVVVLFVALLWIHFAKHWLSSYWLVAPVVLYGLLAVFHEITVRARARADAAAAFYRAGIARIADRWAGTGSTGERFRDPKHVYAEDLDLFGRGCLFELLSTARLPMGENRLAKWLLHPSPIDTIRERQKFIVELREKLDLREGIAVVGEDLRVRLDPESVVQWCEEQTTLGGIGLRLFGFLLAAAAIGTFVYFVHTLFLWPFVAVLLLELTIFIWLRKRAEALLRGVNCNAEGVELFAKIVERLECEAFSSSRLSELVARLKAGSDPASHAIRDFARVVNWIDGRENPFVRIIDLPMLYTIQTAVAAESWRKKYGAQMRIWVDALAEFEALLSLSSYSFEHPADPFPEFVDATASPIFRGEELGHPLIPAAQCVRNNVCLDAQSRVWLVSGSNMSGKSTLLRTVGVNTVLAMAGGPIRGKTLQLTPLALGTRLRSTDSLQEGRSTFFTEVLQIRQVFALLDEKCPLLFLFDELLEGTNSHDRRIGAESLIHALLDAGAIGIVTTHDLALTEITPSLDGALRNMHFQDYVEDGKMRFDYKLREGVVAKSNALELMRMIGLKV